MIPFIVITYSVLALVIVVLILGKKGTEEDNNLKRMKTIGKEVVKVEYKNVDTSFYERVIKPFVTKYSNSDSNGKKQSKSDRQKKADKELAKKLRLAGIHASVGNFKFFRTAFMILSIIIFTCLGIALMSLSKYAILLVVVGLLLGVLVPSLVLNSKIKSHQEAIRSQLADTLDLMSVCMEAGLSFDAALLKISERMEGPLIDEFVTLFKQIQLGKNRIDALKTLSESTNVPELKTFVSAIIQANQLGIPITNVLAAQSEQLRVAKKEQIKTIAAQVPVKMTLPTVLLILPAIICVVIGPVIIQVKDSLTGVF